MNLIYPILRPAHLPTLLLITLLGGLLGGVYGSAHNWVTHSIASEYFTHLKFAQFSHLDIGLPPRVFAAQIGFIAASVMGLASGWFLARTVVPFWPARMALAKALLGLRWIMLIAAGMAVIGYLVSLRTDLGAMWWSGLCESLGVADGPAFRRVALMHTAGYLGVLVGLALTITHLRLQRPRS